MRTMHSIGPSSKKTMTKPNNFTQLQQSCGLSNAEAAELLEVNIGSIDKWRRGKPCAPSGVVDELTGWDFSLQEMAENHYEEITQIIEENLDKIGEEPQTIPMSIYPDDATYRSHCRPPALPFNSMHLNLCNRVASLLRLDDFVVEMVDFRAIIKFIPAND